jgi:flavin reductase (DIM6/NTAB) family NADH-FMN oxidoreductase RutF/DNA-binding MarR family transcriptional regulator
MEYTTSNLLRLLEAGDPNDNERGFRRCLSQYSTGVAVVTARSDDGHVGVTVNSFSSVSLVPPLVLWCISNTSRSYESFSAADAFAINVLSTGQIPVAQRFASSSEDKFAGVSWVPGMHGSPLIAEAAAQLECRTSARHHAGDHLILIGNVDRYALFDAEPLVFSQGRYGRIEDHPEMIAERENGARQIDRGPETDALPFLTLMFEAYQSAVEGFESYRAAEGLSRSQVRVMTGLSESPKITLENLARTKYLGLREAEDAVDGLKERKYVVQLAGGRLELSEAGRNELDLINERWRAFGESRLAGLPKEEVKIARRFMARLLEGSESVHSTVS